MARRKTRLQRFTDLKPVAFAGLSALTAPAPPLRRALSFFPEIAPLPADRVEAVAESVDHRHRLVEPRFAPALARLDPNWDVWRDVVLNRDPFISQRFVGLVREVLVPGHTLTPVDPRSGAQIAFGQRGRSNWNFAHPGPCALATRRLPGPAIVVPAFWNHWHLLLDHLLPLIQAARLRAWAGETLSVVTRARRPPLIDAVVAGVGEVTGLDLRVVEAKPAEVLRPERLLVAVNQCVVGDRNYALAEAIPDARRVFAAAYRDRPAAEPGRRVYVTRRNAKLRRVSNEGELLDGLRRRDVAVLKADWGNHPDQVAAFAKAEVVVGPHGAGLSNLVFAAPGTRVLELFPADHRKTNMLHLSAEHDLLHEPLLGSSEGPDQAFSVDPAAFFRALDALL